MFSSLLSGGARKYLRGRRVNFGRTREEEISSRLATKGAGRLVISF